MLALLQQYKLIAAAVAVAALMALSAGGAWKWQANSYSRQIADIRTEYAEAFAKASAQARTEEQRRQIAVEVIRKDAQVHIAQAETDAVAASSVADGLRVELDRLKRRASSGSGTATGSAPGADTTAMLADLLAEVELAGREMAAEAQRRGIAGSVCERAYDSLSGSP